MTAGARLIVAGLPRTGKTSFIAALWQYLESRDPSGSLRLEQEPTNKKYLNHILDEWNQAIELTRTGSSSGVAVSFDLATPAGQSLQLEIPDFYGEAYRDLWANGIWPNDLLELAQRATGILFFIHPQTVGMPVTVAQENQVLAAAGLPAAEGTVTAAFDPGCSPTGTKVVFLLQALQEAAGKPLPIAIVVSAWDAMAPGAIPEEWLRETLPLVHQFLKANTETSPYAVFGISAMGGDVTVAAVRTKLLAKEEASKRIIVQEGTGRHNDITRPITWLAGSGRNP